MLFIVLVVSSGSTDKVIVCIHEQTEISIMWMSVKGLSFALPNNVVVPGGVASLTSSRDKANACLKRDISRYAQLK